MRSPSLDQRVKEVVPLRVGLKNQSNLPGSRPMLHVVLALDRSLNCFVMFEVDQALDRILLGKACNQPIPMLVNSPHKIVRHPRYTGCRSVRSPGYIRNRPTRSDGEVRGCPAPQTSLRSLRLLWPVDGEWGLHLTRSPILTIFWHCGGAHFSSRTAPERGPGNEPSTVLAEDSGFSRVWQC